MEHEDDSNTNCNRYTWNNPQRFIKGLEDLEIREKVETI